MDHLAAGLPAAPDRPRVSFHGVDFDETLIQRAKETSAGHRSAGETPSFTAVDVMADGAEERLRALLGPGEERFDVAFCFSVSMWIHLNHGDAGLESFFGLLSRLSRFVVLEPQPWRCYQTAARRMRKLGQPEFEHMRLIGHRDKDLEPFILAACERAGLRVKGDFGTTNWKRKLLLLENAQVVMGNSK